MPTVHLNKKVFEKLVGKKLPLDKLKDRISMLGTDLEKIEGNEITVEVFPNRPDMLSEQGFARAFSSFIGVKTGLRKYKVNPSKYDMALFIADKLMWDQGGVPSYFDVVNAALNHSLEMACLAYIDFVIDNNLILAPHPDLLSAKKYLEDLVSSKQILLH